MARAVKVLVDPSVRMSAFVDALSAAGFALHGHGGTLRVVPGGKRAPRPCAEPGCETAAGVLDPGSGDALCPSHALARLTEAARFGLDSHFVSA